MANQGNIVRKWYILDAAGKPLGKTAAIAAVLLRGKHKPEYTPHADCGDFVIVLNAEKAVLTARSWSRSFTAPTPVIPAVSRRPNTAC
jgi:large subunit ribosomal protein L13